MLSAMSQRLIAEPSDRDKRRRDNRKRLNDFRFYRAAGYSPRTARMLSGL